MNLALDPFGSGRFDHAATTRDLVATPELAGVVER
jgi:hypothetical protein